MDNQNSITLKNFLAMTLKFFMQEMPKTEEIYLNSYALVSHAWVAIHKELDKYSISNNLKCNLKQLFELAENFFSYANCIEHDYKSSFMQQKWQEMHHLAKRISFLNS